MAITIERQGQRVYLVGDTYGVKDQIKSIGGHWDGDRRAWWVGSVKAAEAEKLIGIAVSQQTSSTTQDDARLVGKATYKGKSYYVLWMGVYKSGAEKVHLTTLDGKIDFWADLSACEITKRYEPREYRGRIEYQTLGSIRRFVEREQQNRQAGGEVCAECGKSGELVSDLEDGMMKHRHCCDIEP